MVMPFGCQITSSKRRAASSNRRKAPAKPISSSALFRAAAIGPSSVSMILTIRSRVSGFFLAIFAQPLEKV
jgi:hypothetical protein